MPGKRAFVAAGARAAVGLAGAVLAVAAVGSAALVQWPYIERDPVSSLVTPVPSEQVRVCPGPLLTLAEDSNQASAVTSVGRAFSLYAARDASGAEQLPPVATEIEAVDNSTSSSDGSPVVVSVPAEEKAAMSLLTGSQSQTAAVESLGGLAAASCTEATAEAWLVGGSTDIGHTSLVLLSNPTTVLATVDLAVYGETGLVDAPGANGILVQPGTQQVVSLAGLAPNVKSPVVHVLSHGGRVSASLEHSLIEGIEPAGVELTGPAGAPAQLQVIPGMLVAAQASSSGGNSADVGALPANVPSVRIFVPGPDAASVEVGITSEDGQASGDSLQVEIQPGVVTEVPLEAIATGNFVVRLDSDQPLVASAFSSTSAGETRDFAWFTSGGMLAETFLVSAADGPSPSLHLYNSDASDVEVTVTSDTGREVAATVTGGGSAVVPLSAATSYTVTARAGLVASVGYSGGGLLSSFTLSAMGPLATPITVYER
ncbi:MAG: hypothetical protein JWQ68_133 [Cryobacterium sp.]|jgi:hypothetical protein|nr:hypothetical protein [Cryobacterium sp.]